MSTNYQQPQHDAVWRRCLASAFRTAVACTVVGCAVLYGPSPLSCQIAFPSFSYVTVILTVTDAALGDALRGCWLALYGTVLGVCPAALSLCLIGPARLTIGSTSAAVAASAFVVALPERTPLVAKRIALGQIILMYVVAFADGGRNEGFMHPVRLAASTALGAAASVVALLFPYPRLACCEVKENCKLYTENASQRLKLYMKAFSAEDKASPNAVISQAKSLNKAGNKLLQSIRSKQESMEWERIPVFFKSHKQNPGETLEGLEAILRGMENALPHCSKDPTVLLSSELKTGLNRLEEQILNQVKSMALENAVLPELVDGEMDTEFIQTLHTYMYKPVSFIDLPSLFFMFCLRLLQTRATDTVSPKQKHNNEAQLWGVAINKKRLMPSLKCSLSLGFAVFFGLVYSKENGIWSGLPVATSLAAASEATFMVANIKAQGTVLGSIYGVVGCFVFQRYVKVRFICLLPWFIFSSFLRQSKMYGQAGGVSAIVGALLILGRKDFGTPSEFAIDRIVETFIGLSCSIMVDILLQPTLAAVLAKLQLSTSLGSLREAIDLINLDPSSRFSLEEGLKKLKSNLNLLGKYTEEAEVEPNFWFIPFNGACYGKLKVSLSKMVDYLQFGCLALRCLEQESQKMDGKIWKEAAGKLETDIKQFKDAVCSGIRCFEEVTLVKSIATLEREYEKGKASLDLEMGKSGNVVVEGSDDADEMDKSTTSFLQHLNEDGVEKDGEVRLSLGAMAFCMDGVVKETKEIEKAVKEIVQWENPSTKVDLHDILCKLRALKRTVDKENE